MRAVHAVRTELARSLKRSAVLSLFSLLSASRLPSLLCTVSWTDFKSGFRITSVPSRAVLIGQDGRLITVFLGI
jgi:hypothetical protein